MLAFPSADRIGGIDGRDIAFCESLYLLNDRYQILGMRPADRLSGPTPAVGDLFFEHFPITQAELATLRRMTNGVNENSLLFFAGERPMLAVCAPYAASRMLLIAVPEGDLRTYLSRPAGYDGRLDSHNRLTFSTTALSRNAPISANGGDRISRWVSHLHQPFFYDAILGREYDAEVAVLAVRIQELAKLCGCAVQYDLSDMSYHYPDLYTFEMVIPTLLAVLMAARRLSPHRSVEVRGWYDATVGTLCATRFDAEAEASIPEFATLNTLAEEYRRIFFAMRNPEQPECCVCQFLTSVPDLEAMDLKQHPLVQRALEGTLTSPWQVFRLSGTKDEEDISALHRRMIEDLEIKPIPSFEDGEKQNF